MRNEQTADEVKVQISNRPDPEFMWVPYERREDGNWYVEGNDTPFADGSASVRTVRQLIRKEYSVLY